MEELISLLPQTLTLSISQSTPTNLLSTCSSLLDLLLPSSRFQQILRDFADPETGLRRKSANTAAEWKSKGNQCFSDGDYRKALAFYSKALCFAPKSCTDAGKELISTTYANRASSLQRLDFLEMCITDCNRALDVAPSYAKAWYRRGKANASLLHYEDAIKDFKNALNLTGSVAQKGHIKEELAFVSSLRESKNIRSSTNSRPQGLTDVEPCQAKLECVSTGAKGRGMVSTNDMPPGSIVHSEEPLAAVLLKSCRETHCHFCFNEIPVNPVFCLGCATPSYCNEQCRTRAEPEHRHECGGINWPAVLPSDAVLAGRIMANFIDKGGSLDGSKHIETADFCHNYGHVSPERKLELHIYSIMLTCCLNHYFGSKFPTNGLSTSQLVILLCQIKINSMAVVCIKSYGSGTMKHGREHHTAENAYTCNINQVRVGQAIYLTGRLFNHSCQPNIHVYYLSRKLFIRSTEHVPAGCPLEFSYGAQVGQMDYLERQTLLKAEYFFTCQCICCSELSLSDLVLHAFCCSKPQCFGAVLEMDCGMTHIQKAEMHKQNSIHEVAQLLLQEPGRLSQMGSTCLNCGSYCDLTVLRKQAEDAMVGIKWLQQAVAFGDLGKMVPTDVLRALSRLRSVRHPYSIDIGQAEDIVAEAYCLIGDIKSALKHCKASVKVLRKLYHENHIVLGNELVKLASLQLALNDRISARSSIELLERIFSVHYGSHAATVFPYLEVLIGQTSN